MSAMGGKQTLARQWLTGSAISIPIEVVAPAWMISGNGCDASRASCCAISKRSRLTFEAAGKCGVASNTEKHCENAVMPDAAVAKPPLFLNLRLTRRVEPTRAALPTTMRALQRQSLRFGS
jgi:hypothetical protein